MAHQLAHSKNQFLIDLHTNLLSYGKLMLGGHFGFLRHFGFLLQFIILIFIMI
jgi:hypothetical protein